MKDSHKSLLAQVIFVVAVIAVWEIIWAMKAFPELMWPSIGSIWQALVDGITSDGLLAMTGYTLELLLKGLAVGIVLAFLFSSLSMVSKTFYSVYNLVVSIMDLIPGIALLPLAIIWFGVGEMTVIVIVVHGMVWPMSRNIIDGFNSISKIYIEGGQNIGLKGLSLVTGVYIPASFASILSGLRVGWARAWRGLIAIEMVFGTTGSGAGLGWYIMMRRTQFDLAGVIAVLVVITLIGVIIEYGVFRTLEKNTVKKWGMVA